MAVEVETLIIASQPQVRPEGTEEVREPYFPLPFTETDLKIFFSPQTLSQARHLALCGKVQDTLDTRFMYAYLRTVDVSSRERESLKEGELARNQKSDQVIFSDALERTHRFKDQKIFQSQFPHIFPQSK